MKKGHSSLCRVSFSQLYFPDQLRQNVAIFVCVCCAHVHAYVYKPRTEISHSLQSTHAGVDITPAAPLLVQRGIYCCGVGNLGNSRFLSPQIRRQLVLCFPPG